MSKVFATRLRQVISFLIGEDQSYCVLEHSIYDNVFLVRDLISMGQNTSHGFGLLLLDQEKAFDSVDHDFLFAVLTKVGLGENFISGIKLLYNNASCLLKVNNSLCHSFPFQRGICQGCPLSGMLYTLSVEPLLTLLRASMSGVSLADNSKFVISAYADDLCVAVSNQQDVTEVSRCFANFELALSARVNFKKEVSRFGCPLIPSLNHCLHLLLCQHFQEECNGKEKGSNISVFFWELKIMK